MLICLLLKWNLTSRSDVFLQAFWNSVAIGTHFKEVMIVITVPE